MRVVLAGFQKSWKFRSEHDLGEKASSCHRLATEYVLHMKLHCALMVCAIVSVMSCSDPLTVYSVQCWSSCDI